MTKDEIAHSNDKATGLSDDPSRVNDRDSLSGKIERLEVAPDANEEYVDIETERSILRKLDIRIVPMVMWVYLMNMMDRGTKASYALCTSSSD